MREVGSKLAERGELLGLLLQTRDLANAIEQGRDATLPHGRNGDQHLGEEVLVDVECPRGAHRVTVPAVSLHARVGEFAGHLAGAANEECDRAGLQTPYLDLTFEDEVQIYGGLAFAKDESSVFADTLLAVGGEPGVLLFAETVERSYVAQCGDDFRNGSRFRGGSCKNLLLRLVERLVGKQAFVAVQSGHVGGAPSAALASIP